MYQTLLFSHSLFRWLVLVSLLYAIFRAYSGFITTSTFTKTDNAVRHWTATMAHIQLLIGFTMYFISPIVKAYFASEDNPYNDLTFFGTIHILVMFVSIILITIGSALAKRQSTDRAKFRTMLIWFSISLLLIFLAIPWPFSPLANRPYFRAF